MPIIKPILDLRNYGEVMCNVSVSSPVLLNKSGHGRYAFPDIEDYAVYEKIIAWRSLKKELDKGRSSGEENGWIPADEVWARIEERYNG